MHVEPRPEQEPSVEQLSALHDILANGSCYVDLSIWGPHQIRILKAMKLSGLIMSSSGELIPHEFKGPPDFDHWRACWDVYQSSMIMLKACNPACLIAYADFIGRYARRYGQKCWALIYQMETRFRRESMERIRRRASNDLDKAIARGQTSTRRGRGSSSSSTLKTRLSTGTQTLRNQPC